MSKYTKVKVSISEGQRKKLKDALENNVGEVTIHLDHEGLMIGEDVIAVTKRQIKSMTKAFENKKGIRITMSPTQLKHNLTMKGGFLGMLAGLAARALPFLATAAKTILPSLGIGALSGVANAGVQKLMGNGLYLKKGGCVCKVETDGKGLYLDSENGKGLELFGDGLYMKRGDCIVDGKGLLLGSNSPFKNIPILGLLL